MNLLPREIVRLVGECREKGEKGENFYDLIGGLFRQMSNPVAVRGGRFLDVPCYRSSVSEYRVAREGVVRIFSGSGRKQRQQELT